ncbi:CAMK/CAMKL/MARK protein kinase [Saprolegnia parasitica CBS 223.65]|uniref:CAMK/CAMKL/MARK protein kinase n=1 Tax=Saprolegnia parasitica (strain CBS 223.65) TaxID=695850 RepID=A0A067BZ80_SAPPC|nr:CAMK/CAMKL/MARK protein kinase [Saprolegnia parasitica CBS 223.65]KDO22145.1 CAMK/CAMKL/MARK protein kinase [Saprolegnia parasitica CBS 223.65]|eukprot:XP_012207182.1 CAMK/CAMKL/MARK protein kinase [Saprolegnia parasitica CBS 223.65]
MSESMTWTSPWTAYEAIQLLGEGGFGEVYLARHYATDHLVALKALRLATSDAASARREIEIAVRVCHPNLVMIYEWKFTVSYLLLATEYCPNGDLFDFNQTYQPLPLQTIRKFTGQIAAGLGALHAAHVMHRDIKPENIYVDHNENLKIGDFGMAIFCHRPRLDNCWIDVWAAGVVLYELLTAESPFRTRSSILRGEYEMPDYASPLLQDLLRGMLAVDPRRRLSPAAIAAHPWLTSL